LKTLSNPQKKENKAMSYNGYTNYETWAVSTWLDNERGSYFGWLNRAKELLEDDTETANTELAHEIRQHLDEFHPLADSASLYSDLLNAALAKVDWYEVAEGFIETAKEELESEE
jgi:hypothetical protein